MNIDELLTTWRYRHAQMVMRMIGNKIGTGGSSGHDYLVATAEKHKIFKDLHSISSLLIPRFGTAGITGGGRAGTRVLIRTIVHSSVVHSRYAQSAKYYELLNNEYYPRLYLDRKSILIRDWHKKEVTST